MSRPSRRAFLLLFGALGAVAAMLVAGPAPATSASAAAGTAVRQVAVIPPDAAPAPLADEISMAGTTGFLHEYDFGSQYRWTDYATGRTVPVPALAGTAVIRPAGGDSVAVVNSATITETDLASMTTQKWTLPAGYFALGVSGSWVLAIARASTGPALYLLNFASDGTDTVTPVIGLPAGATNFSNQVTIADAASMIVRYTVSGALQYGLLDLATATVTPIPATSGAPVALSADRIAFYDATSEAVRAYSRAGLLDGTDTAATVTLPGASGVYEVALAGDLVIAVPGTTECRFCGYTVKPALDVPLSGAAAGQALPEAQTGTGALAQGPDGAALIVGGSGAADWSVHQFVAGAGDQLSDTAVLRLTGPISNGGLTISEGLVRHAEVQQVPGGTPAYLLFNHLLVSDASGFLAPGPQLNGGQLTGALPCATGASCVQMVDGNWYGTSFLAANSATSMNLREVIDAGTSSMTLSLGSAGGTIADAGVDFVIVDGVNPARQYLVNVGQEQIASTGPVTGAALWFNTLWRSDGAGRLRATNLDTNTAATPVATRANCVAGEIQATQRWIYWSCGQNGPAGVYDQRTHAEIAVPAGPMLLGDGYLVHRDSSTGDLLMYDVHTDSVAAPVTLATGVSGGPAGSGGPAADGRTITWAVDKYSGDVAYVAADDSVHVLSAGVPATPAALTYPPSAWLPNGSLYFGQYGAWQQGVMLSRPVTSWALTVRAAGTSHVVRTQSGGGARMGFWLSWNGRLANGAKAYSGHYTWTLTVHTADSAAATTVRGGTLTVSCGQIPYRSYDCDGAPGLLADLGAESHWYEGGAFNGRLQDNGYTDSWPLCSYSYCVSTIVPFGDINGDGYADIIVKYRTGKLVAYLGIGQGYYNPDGGTKSVSLGTGWNAYSALAYPGDLTGDGKPDLVGRDSAGRLWLFAGNGKGGFKKRMRIGGSWGGYSRLVGAGDLTGDGTGDLLAIDKSGVMWLFPGNGHGGFKKRVRVSSGWSKYNAVIGIGNLGVHGCNDLVARDRHGTMWRFDGNCKGGFAAPVKIGTGWSKYKGLF